MIPTVNVTTVGTIVGDKFTHKFDIIEGKKETKDITLLLLTKDYGQEMKRKINVYTGGNYIKGLKRILVFVY